MGRHLDVYTVQHQIGVVHQATKACAWVAYSPRGVQANLPVSLQQWAWVGGLSWTGVAMEVFGKTHESK